MASCFRLSFLVQSVAVLTWQSLPCSRCFCSWGRLVCWSLLGVERTRMVYPLVMHVPLALFLIAGLRRPFSSAVVGVLCAYLCCQIPRWLADAKYLFTSSGALRNVAYVFLLAFAYALLHRYAVRPVQRLAGYSRQSALMLGAVPALYYVFDYAATVYSDALYSGNAFVVQCAPTIMAFAYFFFLLAYHAKNEEHERARNEQELLALRLNRASAELASMRQTQEQARQYRHDVRHHLALMMGFVESGDIARLEAYLRSLDENLLATAPKRYCKNDVIDLLLSHFAAQAQQAGVTFDVQAHLPAELPFEDADVCSLLSNGLENAITAASCVSGGTAKKVTVRLSIKQENLLISIKNPYEGTVEFEDGLPVATRKGHGFGMRSIASVVNRHEGHVSFFAEEGAFTLWVMLPLNR